MPEALCIAVLGAAGTGKSRLAAALAQRIERDTGLRSTWVAQQWPAVDAAHGGAAAACALARAQHARIDAAAAEFEVVVCDTSALQLAACLRQACGDRSLDDMALQLHRRAMALTLLTAIDHCGTGGAAHARDEVERNTLDGLLRELLDAGRLPWVLASDRDDVRVDAAVDAVAPVLRGRRLPRAGLFTRLQQRNAMGAAWTWACEDCDVPECEHLVRRRADP